MRGLSKDPRQRYPDAVAFAAALRDAVVTGTPAAEPGLMARMKSIFKI